MMIVRNTKSRTCCMFWSLILPFYDALNITVSVKHFKCDIIQTANTGPKFWLLSLFPPVEIVLTRGTKRDTPERKGEFIHQTSAVYTHSKWAPLTRSQIPSLQVQGCGEVGRRGVWAGASQGAGERTDRDHAVFESQPRQPLCAALRRTIGHRLTGRHRCHCAPGVR